jgi:hypothetical protein
MHWNKKRFIRKRPESVFDQEALFKYTTKALSLIKRLFNVHIETVHLETALFLTERFQGAP